MKKIISDLYLILFRLLKVRPIALVLAIAIVSVLNFYILYGFVMLCDGMLPVKQIIPYFKNSTRFMILGAVALATILVSLGMQTANMKPTKRPNYVLQVFFFLIATVLILYINFVDSF